jgi:hypothetical protein
MNAITADPETSAKSIGFKEWALVCDAIGRGEQRVILRKGGIAEGRDGFAFRHREFFLFPTYFHEQTGRLRGDRELPPQRTGEIAIRYFVKVREARRISRWSEIEELEPLHILKREAVRERFEYGDKPGLYVAFLEAFALAKKWVLPDRPAFRGCRSWINLPASPNLKGGLLPISGGAAGRQSLDRGGR